ncbi:hypothetical protein EB796_017778 [Bugula neritina]|uniref:Uncharacterized protein n=1 Tax=Bugula neritina TaxID=10212 RepID=A0A7J7JE50_BUGNE|nr:hypothetical protein EB796_017778 [Bugula neritina]
MVQLCTLLISCSTAQQLSYVALLLLCRWFGSEYRAVQVSNWLAFGSWAGISCYIYGRRHIRHAGSFQRIIYPAFTSTFFLAASHLSWALIRSVMSNQECFGHQIKVLIGLLSGVMFLHTGRSYLRFIDHW